MWKHRKIGFPEPNPLKALKTIPLHLETLSALEKVVFLYPVVAAVTIGIVHLGGSVSEQYFERIGENWVVSTSTFVFSFLLLTRNSVAYFIFAPGCFFFGGLAHLFGSFDMSKDLLLIRLGILVVIYIIPAVLLFWKRSLFLIVEMKN